MKGIKLIYITIGFFLLFISSCSKNKDQKKSTFEEILSIGNPQTPDDSLRNYVVLKVGQTLNAYDTVNSYAISSYAKFIDDNGNAVNVGNITVGGQTMTPGANNIYELGFAGPLLSTGKSFIGNQVQINIPGGGDYPSFSKTIYLPKSMIITGLSYPYDRLVKSQNLTLNWTPDPNNVFKKCLIQLFYYPALSKIDNSNFPNSINSVTSIVSDNGQYTIPSTALSAFPIGCSVGIIISRAVEYHQIVISPISGKQIQVFYYSIIEAKTIPLKVL